MMQCAWAYTKKQLSNQAKHLLKPAPDHVSILLQTWPHDDSSSKSSKPACKHMPVQNHRYRVHTVSLLHSASHTEIRATSYKHYFTSLGQELCSWRLLEHDGQVAHIASRGNRCTWISATCYKHTLNFTQPKPPQLKTSGVRRAGRPHFTEVWLVKVTT